MLSLCIPAPVTDFLISSPQQEAVLRHNRPLECVMKHKRMNVIG